MEFGKALKEKRKEKGYSLEYIQEETKIRKFYLEALEKEDFAVLPYKVYAVGFVKKYSRFLELDEKEMVDWFIHLAYPDEEDDDEMVIDGFEKEPKPIPYKKIAVAAVFLLAAIWLGSYLVDILTGNYSDFVVPQAEEQGANNIPDTQKLIDPGEEKKETTPKAALLIEANSECWVNIIVDDVEEFTGVILAGTSKYFEGEQSIYIKAGNAGGIELTYNGKRTEPLGSVGAVEEKVFLATEQKLE